MITALPLTTTPTDDKAVRELSGLGEAPVLKHVQWGFFLGERLAEFGGQDVREHVHLGAWAAGQQIPELTGTMAYQWTGTATYEGVAPRGWSPRTRSEGRVETAGNTGEERAQG